MHSMLSFYRSAKSLSLLGLLFLAGCGIYETDDTVIGAAHTTWQTLHDRYQELTDKLDDSDEAIIDLAAKYGKEMRVGGMWGFFYTLGDYDYLTHYDGAPLHRVLYFMESDVTELGKHIGRLESRLFSHLAVYNSLRTLRRHLQDIVSVVKLSDRYTEEVRALDTRALQREQVRELRKQNSYIIQSLVRTEKPVVIEETTTIVTKKRPEKKIIVANQPETIAEVDVDDVPVGATILV